MVLRQFRNLVRHSANSAKTNSTTAAPTASPTKMSAGVALHKQLEEEIAAHPVVIYSKSYCPYCAQTKALFAAHFPHVDVQVREMDQERDGARVQRMVLTLTGQRTVPNVFVNGKHIGGNDQVQRAFREGTLATDLAGKETEETQQESPEMLVGAST
jgi:glutaredoxin 3